MVKKWQKIDFVKIVGPNWKLVYDHIGELTYADILIGTRHFSIDAVVGVALGQNVSNSNRKSDFVAMETAVYATIPSKIWLDLKVIDFDNTKMYRFLHPFLYLFSYTMLSIWIFGDHKPGPQTSLMTWVELMILHHLEAISDKNSCFGESRSELSSEECVVNLVKLTVPWWHPCLPHTYQCHGRHLLYGVEGSLAFKEVGSLLSRPEVAQYRLAILLSYRKGFAPG